MSPPAPPADNQPSDPVPIPITGELDLHTFSPKDTQPLLAAYFEACLAKKIFNVRVIHGKGIGTLRETVHACLRKSPFVKSFHLGDETSGGWGATHVILHSPFSKTTPTPVTTRQ